MVEIKQPIYLFEIIKVVEIKEREIVFERNSHHIRETSGRSQQSDLRRRYTQDKRDMLRLRDNSGEVLKFSPQRYWGAEKLKGDSDMSSEY